MEKNAPYFIVGIFVTVTVLLFVGFMIWLVGPHDDDNLTFYTVEFKDSISGLEEGSKVKYKGVDVGKVIKTRLIPGDTAHIHVDIGIDKETPVRLHTKTVLETQGITGLVQLEMSTATNDKQPPEQRPDMKYPILYGEGSNLYKALEDLPVITSQIMDLTGKLNKTLDPSTLASVRSTIVDTGHMARSASGLADKLKANPSQLIYQPSKHGVEIPP